MSQITPEQIILLEAAQRFKDVSTQYIKDRAIFMVGLDGTSGQTAGKTPEGWARQRYLAKGIVLHPQSQNYGEWISQFTSFLKGQNVWETDVDGTITAMIASGKFEELADLTYTLRGAQLEF